VAKDPTCKMEIEESEAVELEYNGQIYYFCSEACRKQFEENPQLYLQKAPIEE